MIIFRKIVNWYLMFYVYKYLIIIMVYVYIFKGFASLNIIIKLNEYIF